MTLRSLLATGLLALPPAVARAQTPLDLGRGTFASATALNDRLQADPFGGLDAAYRTGVTHRLTRGLDVSGGLGGGTYPNERGTRVSGGAALGFTTRLPFAHVRLEAGAQGFGSRASFDGTNGPAGRLRAGRWEGAGRATVYRPVRLVGRVRLYPGVRVYVGAGREGYRLTNAPLAPGVPDRDSNTTYGYGAALVAPAFVEVARGAHLVVSPTLLAAQARHVRGTEGRQTLIRPTVALGLLVRF